MHNWYIYCCNRNTTENTQSSSLLPKSFQKTPPHIPGSVTLHYSYPSTFLLWHRIQTVLIGSAYGQISFFFSSCSSSSSFLKHLSLFLYCYLFVSYKKEPCCFCSTLRARSLALKNICSYGILMIYFFMWNILLFVEFFLNGGKIYIL